MINSNVLETFRTKVELINYFKENGQNITEEEIEGLKKNYAKAEENGSALSLQQLDNVAGGLQFIFKYMTREEHRHILAHPEDGYRNTYHGFEFPVIEDQSYDNPQNGQYRVTLVKTDNRPGITYESYDITGNLISSGQNLTAEQFCDREPGFLRAVRDASSQIPLDYINHNPNDAGNFRFISRYLREHR